MRLKLRRKVEEAGKWDWNWTYLTPELILASLKGGNLPDFEINLERHAM
jgi:hypothetical protein